MKDGTPNAWRTVKIGDVCDLMTGGTPSRTKPEYFDGDIKWLVSGDIHRGEITECEGRITELGLKNSNARILPENSVIIALNGQGKTRGTVAMLRTEATCNQSLVSITPKNASELLPEYVFMNLHGRYEEIRRMTGDAGNERRGLNMRLIRGIEIPLPPLEEQQRIVAVLDEAFEGLARARAHAEANLQNARELFGSALQAALQDETVSWNDLALADLGDVVTGSTPKTSDKGNLGDHIPFVKPGDFSPDGSLVYDNQGLSKQGAAVSRVLPAGSALMVCIGATIGKAGYSDRPIATNQQINAVTPKDGISGEYLYYQMLTPEFQADVMRGAGQATLPIINKGKWSKLKVRMPSDLSKQAGIVDKLSSIRARVDAASTQYGAQILDLDDLRQSLLQKAFAGELT